MSVKNEQLELIKGFLYKNIIDMQQEIEDKGNNDLDKRVALCLKQAKLIDHAAKLELSLKRLYKPEPTRKTAPTVTIAEEVPTSPNVTMAKEAPKQKGLITGLPKASRRNPQRRPAHIKPY